MARRALIAVAALPIFVVSVAIARFGTAEGSASASASTVDRARSEVRFQATVHPDAMYRPFGVHGHHAVVARGGRAARWALFRADADDLEVRKALEKIGARPGENLPATTWSDRGKKEADAPALRVEGDVVEILVSWRGSAPRPLSTFLQPENARNFDFRFGGNERHRAEFRSGCIVCLYSCPGGAIGNRNRTIRDWMQEGPIYRAKNSLLPKSGSVVTIHIRKKMEAA